MNTLNQKAVEQSIKSMFKSYTKLTSSMKTELNNLGLVVVLNGKHYKIYRADGIGSFVTLSKTPSDHRTGLNAGLCLIRLLRAA